MFWFWGIRGSVLLDSPPFRKYASEHKYLQFIHKYYLINDIMNNYNKFILIMLNNYLFHKTDIISLHIALICGPYIVAILYWKIRIIFINIKISNT